MTDFYSKCIIPGCIFHADSIDELKQHYFEVKDELHLQYSPFRELSIEELCKVLDSTIKYDNATKAIIFLDFILAQTDEESFNVTMTGGSSEGKTYTTLQCASYFPEFERIEISGASPTAFFHERGVPVKEVRENGSRTHIAISDELEQIEKSMRELQENENKSKEDSIQLEKLKNQKAELLSHSKRLVDLEGKILIFLDQPNPQLLERMRGFFSHDKKELEFSITNKNARGSNRTEHIILRGYSSVVFCTAHSFFDDQEATRNVLLSPETSQAKLNETLKLIALKKSNPRMFQEQLEQNLDRKSLLQRVELIRGSGLSRFDSSKFTDSILNLFTQNRQFKQPRHQRDFPRIFNLIYGHALLNFFNREASEEDEYTIQIQKEDVIEGFKLYDSISEANEHNVSPEVYTLFKEVLVPLCERKSLGVGSLEIQKAYFEKYNRPIGQDKLRKQIIPALKIGSLITESKDTMDARRTLYSPIVNTSGSEAKTDFGILSTPESIISPSVEKPANSGLQPTEQELNSVGDNPPSSASSRDETIMESPVDNPTTSLASNAGPQLTPSSQGPYYCSKCETDYGPKLFSEHIALEHKGGKS